MTSKIKWTPEQLDAINTKGGNLLVAAAAGAGKTAVLVERIIQRVMDPVDPVDIDRLLVVTFTNAAATEMKERIGDALASALEQDDDSQILQRQLALLNRSSITTIHSFCLEVIRNNFHQLDIDPNFRIANQTEGVLLKLEALEELFEDRYLEEYVDAEFLNLVECYSSNRDDKRLQDMVLNLYNFVQSHPWPEKWLDEHSQDFNISKGRDFGTTTWGKELMGNLKIEIAGLGESMKRAIDIIEGAQGLEAYLDNFREEYSTIQDIVQSCNKGWESVHNSISGMEFRRLARCGKDADKNQQDQVKKIRDDAKASIRKLQQDLFSLDGDQIIKDLNELYPLMRCLTDLVLELDRRYKDKKRDKNLVDFNDLEHMCLEVLLGGEGEEGKPSKAALELRERFAEVLVDEYQDSNLVQEVILSTVSRKDSQTPNMFMVGDVKQSIYRFRQARPELFMDKYRSYSLDPGSKNRKIQLFKNFRSRKTVIDGVNFIFQQIMSKNVGELDYDDEEALRLGAIFKDNEEDKAPGGHPIEFCIVDMKDDSPVEEQFYEDSLDIIQTEGRIVARRIMELVSGGQFKYRDIVILLRTTVNWAETFADELAIQGIPAYSDSGTGYFKTIEVQTVLALLQIIDNPMQDIPLLAVLRSPIGSWSPEELIDIRLMDRESTVYEALVKMGQEGKGSISEKANEFIQTLNKWRDMSFYLPTDELIWYLYGETGYYSCVGVMPGGAQRQANLRILFQRAGQYEETSYKGLFNFIQFIDKLRTSQGDMGSAKILGENENVVRIMSIHKSKGLEFPVVFLSGCGKQFNFMDTTRNILFHQDLGLGPDYVDCHRRTTYATLAKQALKYKITLETLSEEMRILYVAMTRARERLIISGGVKDLEKEIKSWANALATEELKLPEYQMMGARRYLDWIGPSIIRHEDGKVLRQLVDMPVVNEDSLMVDESRWEIKLYNKLDAMVVNLKEEDDGDSQGVLWDIDDGDQLSIHRQIYDRLEWEYPHLEASKLPVKVSVTELKSYLDGNLSSDILDETGASPLIMPTLVKRPGFLEEEAKTMTSAERGSLLHFVLQHLNLDRELSKENIRDGINRMAEVQLITEEQAEAVDVPRIERFFNSPLGIRMLKAGGIKREVPFTMEIPSSQIYPESSGKPHGDDGIILQGIMDCYFEEPGGIVLVDYKTDYVALDGGLKTIKGRYSSQMNYYTYALERITGKKVIGKYVYLFWNGQVLEY